MTPFVRPLDGVDAGLEARHPRRSSIVAEDEPRVTSIEQQIGDFAAGLTLEQVPAAVVGRVRLLALDSIGCALAAKSEEYMRSATSALSRLSGSNKETSTVIGSSGGIPIRDAAVLNGALIHGLDFDDTHPGGQVHASASVLSTSMAMAENLNLSGASLLIGYALGLEIAARVSLASKSADGANSAMIQAGFHPTGVVGALASSVVAARLRGLDSRGIVGAQGICGSLAAGTMQWLSNGAWTKRLHAGWAANSGIVAAELAAHEYLSPAQAYEGRYGLYSVHQSSSPPAMALEAVTASLGDEWELLNISTKPYPTCSLTHAAIRAVADVCSAQNVQADAIDKIVCYVGAGIPDIVCEPASAKIRPETDYDARFSLQYLLAVAAYEGTVSLHSLTDSVRRDPKILSLAQRVEYGVDPASPHPDVLSATVEVHWHEEVARRRVDLDTFSEEEVVKKFRLNAGLGVENSQASSILEATMSLESCASAAKYMELMRV